MERFLWVWEMLNDFGAHDQRKFSIFKRKIVEIAGMKVFMRRVVFRLGDMARIDFNGHAVRWQMAGKKFGAADADEYGIRFYFFQVWSDNFKKMFLAHAVEKRFQTHQIVSNFCPIVIFLVAIIVLVNFFESRGINLIFYDGCIYYMA